MYKVTIFVDDGANSGFYRTSERLKQDMVGLGYKIVRMTGEYVYEEPTT